MHYIPLILGIVGPDMVEEVYQDLLRMGLMPWSCSAALGRYLYNTSSSGFR